MHAIFENRELKLSCLPSLEFCNWGLAEHRHTGLNLRANALKFGQITLLKQLKTSEQTNLKIESTLFVATTKEQNSK